MFTFCGYELELVVDAVLDRQHGPTLWSASDATGGHWLILEAGHDGHDPAWLCAPISLPALDAVRCGRATLRNAFRHSATGTVELVAIEGGRAVPDRCIRCQDVPEDLLPPADWHLDPALDLGEIVHADRRARPRHPVQLRW